MTTITIGSSSYSLVDMPTAPGFTEISVAMNDTVAEVFSPFTRQSPQVQEWPGADWWEAQVTLPAMPREIAAPWIAFLAELRGKANVLQLGDPVAQNPLGSALGIPAVDNSMGSNQPLAKTLYTKGWAPNQFRLLLPEDHLQIGYRLHKVCEVVNSDSSGNAQIVVWPSLREQPTDGSSVILASPKGLFRLADNKRSYHRTAAGKLTTLSFNVAEAR